MIDLPKPKPAQLVPPGPYVTREAAGFLGLTVAGGRLPVQLRFVLEDDTELHIPISDFALGRLYAQLKGQLEDQEETP
jgi:hypothetical protein